MEVPRHGHGLTLPADGIQRGARAPVGTTCSTALPCGGADAARHLADTCGNRRSCSERAETDSWRVRIVELEARSIGAKADT